MHLHRRKDETGTARAQAPLQDLSLPSINVTNQSAINDSALNVINEEMGRRARGTENILAELHEEDKERARRRGSQFPPEEEKKQKRRGSEESEEQQIEYDKEDEEDELSDEVEEEDEGDLKGPTMQGGDQSNLLSAFKKVTKTKKEKRSEKGDGEESEKKSENGEVEFVGPDDTGSVVSSKKSLMKHLRALRNAVYEHYSPPSIRNLKIYARIVYMILLLITILSFVLSKNLYNNLKENIDNIHESEIRMSSIATIGSNVRVLYLIKKGWINSMRGGGNTDFAAFNYTEKMEKNLDSYSQSLQLSQNRLTNTDFEFSDK